MGRRIECISPLAACMAPLNPMRTSLWQRGFQISCSSIPLSPGSEVCGVFSNRGPFKFLEATKGTGSSLCCSGGLLDFPDQQVNGGGFPYLVLEILLDSLWLLASRGALLPHVA